IPAVASHAVVSSAGILQEPERNCGSRIPRRSHISRNSQKWPTQPASLSSLGRTRLLDLMTRPTR
ncbi:hypothetical protein M5D96_000268, partial [Drosophila gunungcola]